MSTQAWRANHEDDFSVHRMAVDLIPSCPDPGLPTEPGRARPRSARRSAGRSIPTSGAPADPTTALAQDIVAGRVVAGELARHACERHLKDLKDGPKRGLHWRPDLANVAIGFYPKVLTITAG